MRALPGMRRCLLPVRRRALRLLRLLRRNGRIRRKATASSPHAASTANSIAPSVQSVPNVVKHLEEQVAVAKCSCAADVLRAKLISAADILRAKRELNGRNRGMNGRKTKIA